MPDSSVAHIPDKVVVFVSSTIGECEEERKSAKGAIESLNHAPFLFEGAGSRSYSPRTLYFRKLHEAHIFVGIYRNEYGWVAPDMAISGIEDEFKIAMARGIPRLIYVLKDDSARSEELRVFLDYVKLESGVTVSFYDDPSQLYMSLRNDIEAEVAKTFHDRAQLEASLSTDASRVLAAVLPDPQQLVPRTSVKTTIEAAIKNGGAIQVHGPAGIGKTVLLAAMAADKPSIYVAASHLSPKDVAAAIATKIRSQSGFPTVSYFDAAHAYNDLVGVWREAEGLRVILDDCRDPDLVASLMADVGKDNPKKALVYSSRVALDIQGHQRVAIPPMDSDELSELVTLAGEPEMPPDAFEDLLRRSEGNPLYFRLYAVSKVASLPQDLASLESNVWEATDPQDQEILAYVAMSPLPLHVDDLLMLVETDSPNLIFAAIERLRPYVRDQVLGYSLLHDHIGETVRQCLGESAHRHAYYAKRLAELFGDKQDAVSAFQVLDDAGDPAALEYANRAAFDAIRHGNIKQAQRILERQLESVEETGDGQDLVMTLLAIAQIKEQAGFADEAREGSERALAIAEDIGDTALILRAREVRAACLIRQALAPEALEELTELRDIYESDGDLWSCARLDLEKGAILIRMKRYGEAETHTRTCLSLFEQLEDEYGVSLAKRNLASILSESDNNNEEVETLLKGFTFKTPESSNLRERAWFCNLMVRKCRRSEEYPRASEYGREAISIGEQLGDIHLVALNRICLGNVYRDEEDYDKAFAEYFLAAGDAQKAGDRSLEASTSNLIASIHNRMGNTELAIQYSMHAIGLVRGTLAITELADSFEELASAYLGAGQDQDAAKAYVDAAAALKGANKEEELFRLAMEGLFILVEDNMVQEYITAFRFLFGEGSEADRPEAHIDELYDAIWRVLPRLPRTRITDFCGLHFRLMFEGIPTKVGRYLFGKLSRDLIARRDEYSDCMWRMLFPILPLLISAPAKALRLPDIAVLGDGLHRACPGLSFKPLDDGAAHWVVELDLGTPFLCTITQMDDGTDTATAAMILAVFLKGFEQDIRDELFTAEGIATSEINVQIFNTRDLPQIIEKQIDSTLDDQVCVVTRPTNPTDKTTPTIVICRDDIASNWSAGMRGSGSMQILIGYTLVELVYRLFGGEVDLESLRPKIVGLVRKTLS